MHFNRRTALQVFAAGLLSAAGLAGAGTDLSKPAPGFELPTGTGQTVSLESLRGQVVMLNFWASWCGPCRQEFPVLDAMYRKYQPMGFTLLAINVEPERADAQRFLDATPVSFPIAYDADNSVTRAYGVSAMPTTLMIDRKGQVRWVHLAYKPGDENAYMDTLRTLLREAP